MYNNWLELITVYFDQNLLGKKGRHINFWTEYRFSYNDRFS